MLHCGGEEEEEEVEEEEEEEEEVVVVGMGGSCGSGLWPRLWLWLPPPLMALALSQLLNLTNCYFPKGRRNGKLGSFKGLKVKFI